MAYKVRPVVLANVATAAGDIGQTPLDFRLSGGQQRVLCAQRSNTVKDANVAVSVDNGQSWMPYGDIFGVSTVLTMAYLVTGAFTNLKLTINGAAGTISVQGVL